MPNYGGHVESFEERLRRRQLMRYRRPFYIPKNWQQWNLFDPKPLFWETFDQQYVDSGLLWHETFDNQYPLPDDPVFHEGFENQFPSYQQDWHEPFSNSMPIYVSARYIYWTCEFVGYDENGHPVYQPVRHERAISVTTTLKAANGAATVESGSTPYSFSANPTFFSNPWTLTVPATYSGTPLYSWIGGSNPSYSFNAGGSLTTEAVYDQTPYFGGCS